MNLPASRESSHANHSCCRSHVVRDCCYSTRSLATIAQCPKTNDATDTKAQNDMVDSLLQRISEMQVLESMLHHRVGQLEGHILNELQEKASLIAENERLKMKLDYYESSSSSHSTHEIDELVEYYPLRADEQVSSSSSSCHNNHAPTRDKDDEASVEPILPPVVPSQVDPTTCTGSSHDEAESKLDYNATTIKHNNNNPHCATAISGITTTRHHALFPHDYHIVDNEDHVATDSDDGETTTYDYIPLALKAVRRKTKQQPWTKRANIKPRAESQTSAKHVSLSATTRVFFPPSPCREGVIAISHTDLKEEDNDDDDDDDDETELAVVSQPSSSPGMHDDRIPPNENDQRQDVVTHNTNNDCDERWIMKQHQYNLELLLNSRRRK